MCGKIAKPGRRDDTRPSVLDCNGHHQRLHSYCSAQLGPSSRGNPPPWQSRLPVTPNSPVRNMPPLFKPQQRATLVNNKSGGMQRTQSVASQAGQARACRPLRRVALAASRTVNISVVVGTFLLRLHAGGHAASEMAAPPPQCTEELGVKQS